jgi:hypothetical protein
LQYWGSHSGWFNLFGSSKVQKTIDTGLKLGFRHYTYFIFNAKTSLILRGHIQRRLRYKRKAVRSEAEFFSFSKQAADGSQN